MLTIRVSVLQAQVVNVTKHVTTDRCPGWAQEPSRKIGSRAFAFGQLAVQPFSLLGRDPL